MGGPGSTRWLSHIKKYQVEECLTFSIFELKPYIKVNYSGLCKWFVNDELTNSIAYRVIGNNEPASVQLSYKIKNTTEDKRIISYIVRLTTSNLPKGGRRYWFRCPNINCDRRVAKLYLPPDDIHFCCRNCHNLTYRSSQEQHEYDSVYIKILTSMNEEYPIMTLQDLKSILGRK